MASGLNLLNSKCCNVLSKAPLCLLHHMLVCPTPQTVSSLHSLPLETLNVTRHLGIAPHICKQVFAFSDKMLL